MKYLIAFLFLAHSAFANHIEQLRVEHLVDADGDSYYHLTTWGLLSDGRCKTWDFRTSGLKRKCDDVENCELFNLKRSTLRYFVYFNEDGEPYKCDFHLEDPFESFVVEEFDGQSLKNIADLKAFLEKN